MMNCGAMGGRWILNVCALRRCVAQHDDVDVDLVELLQPHAAGRRLLRRAQLAQRRLVKRPFEHRVEEDVRVHRPHRQVLQLTFSREAASGHALAVDEARLVARLLVKGADSYDDQHDDDKRERVTPHSTQPTIERAARPTADTA
jgi:hypothetical protein